MNLAFAADYSLDDTVVNLLEQKLIIVSHQFEALSQGADAPFRALIILSCISIVLEVSIVLVQAIIGQVHVPLITQVGISFEIILLRCEAN